MVTQGQAFFQASGDDGAYNKRIGQWAASANTTLVGGTVLTTTGTAHGPPTGSWLAETTWQGSGGGFMTNFSIPSWQQGLSTVGNRGSDTYRNVPDVALVADNVWVIYGQGTSNSVGGTSCATPLWAGFMSLVNQELKNDGAPPIGFLNPALYAIGKSMNYAACFHDITNGNNTSGDSPSQFYATTGYDLCTGWGTIRGSNLINALLVVPSHHDIASFFLSGSNLVINGTNGQSGATCYILMGTNLALPLNQWEPIATNVLSASGNFSITATNTVTRNIPQRFYILQTQ